MQWPRGQVLGPDLRGLKPASTTLWPWNSGKFLKLLCPYFLVCSFMIGGSCVVDVL